MRRNLIILLTGLLAASALAGCLGGDDGGPASDGSPDAAADRSVAIGGTQTASERAQLIVGEVEGEVTYGDLVVSVDGAPYAFAAEPSFRDATYSANGVSDPATPVARGDVVVVPAAGQVEVAFHDADSGSVWSRVDVTVPDDDAPSSPALAAPEDGASGVPMAPTFQWAPVADPSGVVYSLQVSLDETFSQDLVVHEFEEISATEFQLDDDEELAPGQTYHWHVRAHDSAGNVGVWSPTWSFTTEPR